MNLETYCDAFDECKSSLKQKIIIKEACSALNQVDKLIFLSHCIDFYNYKIREYENAHSEDCRKTCTD